MKKILKNNWLLGLIILQPVLDVIAFFTSSESGTVSGYIRLLIMLLLLIYFLFTNLGNRKFIVALIVFGLVFLLHVVNGFRTGYKDFFSDLMYAVKVAYMPVMAIVLCLAINNDQMRRQVFLGIIINAVLTGLIIVLSYLTNTFTDTYGPGWGISGWVIPDNRCCHSDILSSCCVFLGYYAVKSKKTAVNILLPVCIVLLLLTNGTQACFYTLFGICFGYPVFLIIRCIMLKDSFNRIPAFLMLFLAVLTIFIYPYTPRYKMEMYERSFFSDTQSKFIGMMNDMGYDIENMTPEDRMNDEVVHDAMVDYYLPFLYSGMPDRTVESFDIDRIIWKYNATIEAGKIGDNRHMKEVFASLMFEDKDFLTRCFGYEFATIGEDLTADLENDWFAVFFYYGYFGFAVYVLAAVYLLYRVVRLLMCRFKASLTDENFCLLMCFVLQIGLAYFSGAILRRPNASIYLSLVVGLIYYSTRRFEFET